MYEQLECSVASFAQGSTLGVTIYRVGTMFTGNEMRDERIQDEQQYLHPATTIFTGSSEPHHSALSEYEPVYIQPTHRML